MDSTAPTENMIALPVWSTSQFSVDMISLESATKGCSPIDPETDIGAVHGAACAFVATARDDAAEGRFEFARAKLTALYVMLSVYRVDTELIAATADQLRALEFVQTFTAGTPHAARLQRVERDYIRAHDLTRAYLLIAMRPAELSAAAIAHILRTIPRNVLLSWAANRPLDTAETE